MTSTDSSSPAGRPAGLRVELFPTDLDAIVDFYVDVLGFTLLRDDRGTSSPYVYLERGAARVGASRRYDEVDPATRMPPVGIELVVEVPDVEGLRDHVAQRWPLEEDLVRRPWGLTDFRVLDPAGHYLRVTGFLDEA